MLAMDHLRLREASHRTTRAAEPEAWPGSDAEALLVSRRGGKSFATQRSPWGEGVRR